MEKQPEYEYTMQIGTDVIMSLFLGIGLSAAVGFRVFVPLLLLALGARFGIMPLNAGFDWLGSSVSILVLSIATVTEILAYFLPFIDNMLDSIAVPLATVAGTTAVAATLTGMDPVVTWALAIIAGGGTATLLKTSGATVRATSSVATAGLGNPIMGVIGTVASILLSVVAISIPVLVIFLVAFVLYFAIKNLKRFRDFFRKKEEQ